MFTGECLSTEGVPGPGGSAPRGCLVQGGCLVRGVCSGRLPGGDTPPQDGYCCGRYAYPTGMYSCYLLIFKGMGRGLRHDAPYLDVLLFLWHAMLSTVLVFSFNNLEDMSPFWWGHRYPLFGLLVMSPLGFKARVNLFTCMLHCLHATDFSVTSRWPTWQLSHFIHILAHKYWWGSSPGLSMLLPHGM